MKCPKCSQNFKINNYLTRRVSDWYMPLLFCEGKKMMLKAFRYKTTDKIAIIASLLVCRNWTLLLGSWIFLSWIYFCCSLWYDNNDDRSTLSKTVEYITSIEEQIQISWKTTRKKCRRYLWSALLWPPYLLYRFWNLQ